MRAGIAVGRALSQTLGECLRGLAPEQQVVFLQQVMCSLAGTVAASVGPAEMRKIYDEARDTAEKVAREQKAKAH